MEVIQESCVIVDAGVAVMDSDLSCYGCDNNNCSCECTRDKTV